MVRPTVDYLVFKLDLDGFIAMTSWRREFHGFLKNRASLCMALEKDGRGTSSVHSSDRKSTNPDSTFAREAMLAHTGTIERTAASRCVH